MYYYICSLEESSTKFEARADKTRRYVNRNPSLDPSVVSNQGKGAALDQYNHPTDVGTIMPLSRNLLLLPPLSTRGATDIKYFTKRYDAKAWGDLYRQIQGHRTAAGHVAVLTEGHQVAYLHVRYARGAQRRLRLRSTSTRIA